MARWRVDYIGKGGKHLGHWFGTRIYAAFGMNCGDGGADASTVALRIELDTHDVIVAESAFSETYIDDDNRGIFQNAHEYWASHPDALREPARYCAPRRDEGYEVEATRRAIETRAGLRSPMDQQKLTLRGFVDDVSSHCIAGWAQTVEHQEAPVYLDICAGGRLIGQVLANRYRKDLQDAGLGSGCHGFVFNPPPGLCFAPNAIEVRRSRTSIVGLRRGFNSTL